MSFVHDLEILFKRLRFELTDNMGSSRVLRFILVFECFNALRISKSFRLQIFLVFTKFSIKFFIKPWLPIGHTHKSLIQPLTSAHNSCRIDSRLRQHIPSPVSLIYLIFDSSRHSRDSSLIKPSIRYFSFSGKRAIEFRWWFIRAVRGEGGGRRLSKFDNISQSVHYSSLSVI